MASLPAGLDSYPSCTQKGAVVRTFLAGAPPFLRDPLSLPAQLRVMNVLTLLVDVAVNVASSTIMSFT